MDVVLESRKPKWVFSRADKMGIGAVVIYSANVDGDGVEVGVKSMETGEQVGCGEGEVLSTVMGVLKK